ncbi:hypothetical protein WI61_07335 [Burkholderia cepacia]|nr:hypothetical protein WI48_01800 [Burkholderia cepacia]KVA70814.1 hypothetical protein WI49_35545 [Burkholderia cepacia]KVA77515.1 hypothetical protein WI52_27130 [Burkholderia cepacia]KVA82349.1 hypothetical protein WI51_24905 [Burkholderia cepacia]KVA84238.1 hypothetical protein WI50_18825 [Burkholderia cepacia]
MGNSSILEHDAALRAAQHEIEVLLDEQHRELRSAAQRWDDLADQLDQIRLHTVGRFVQQQQFRPTAQRAGNREHLLLTTGQRAAVLRESGLENGEILEHLVENRPTTHSLRAHHEVFAHGEFGKNPAPLRNQSDAASGDRMGAQAVDRLPLKPHVTCHAWQQAHDRFDQGRLAHAIAAEYSDNFVWPDVEVELMQHCYVAISGRQILNV